MDMILQELYREGIGLDGHGYAVSESQKQGLKELIAHQDALRKHLDEQTEQQCLEIWEEMNALSADECEHMYVRGMRTGARLVMALLGKPYMSDDDI